ncbi:MAG TPA: hypothetical protein VKR60_08855 [Candidatus Sulfotelmatobacter sp.]|nr:hypothetical protein [Candidatus Sulfotelmatobacter sp.]
MLKPFLLAAALLVITGAVRSANGAEPPADLCALLPAAEVSKILGRTYDSPQKSVAPRPFANTAMGTDCNYPAKASKLWFRAYVDPSPSAAAELFAKLSKFYGPQTPVTGVGDEAYVDGQHAIHVRKGKVRFYLNLDPVTPATEKQIKDLAGQVAARL